MHSQFVSDDFIIYQRIFGMTTYLHLLLKWKHCFLASMIKWRFGGDRKPRKTFSKMTCCNFSGILMSYAIFYVFYAI